MKCTENCPAFWVQGGGGYEYPDEVDCYGCRIYGMYRGGEGDYCNLTKNKIDKKLTELEAYEMGEIDRPNWVAMRFIHDVDISMDLHLPQFPPKRCISEKFKDEFWGEEVICVKNRKNLYGTTDMHYEKADAYRKGYEDAKEGKEFDRYYPKRKEDFEEREDIFDF